ncbi:MULTISPECIES: CfaE/CblD family pilus tip adhesin [unclassified Burkholderia]|uniref:CfaE/CblD family pilus tip adhesin n=1 Tax=unclassified Burkholderia TaxID=2613784 RepID=UPI0024459164|nr:MULTISPECIES: CfaE/CblD family pilus tip adhesin [unclassified Burkholderia]
MSAIVLDATAASEQPANRNDTVEATLDRGAPQGDVMIFNSASGGYNLQHSSTCRRATVVRSIAATWASISTARLGQERPLQIARRLQREPDLSGQADRAGEQRYVRLKRVNNSAGRSVSLPGISAQVVCTRAPSTLETPEFQLVWWRPGKYSNKLTIMFTPPSASL